jgi:hypothetical protein
MTSAGAAKHLEVIKAFAAGVPCQHSHPTRIDWVDMSPDFECNFDPAWLYRIKPKEPRHFWCWVRDKPNLDGTTANGYFWPTKVAAEAVGKSYTSSGAPPPGSWSLVELVEVLPGGGQ